MRNLYLRSGPQDLFGKQGGQSDRKQHS